MSSANSPFLAVMCVCLFRQTAKRVSERWTSTRCDEPSKCVSIHWRRWAVVWFERIAPVRAPASCWTRRSKRVRQRERKKEKEGDFSGRRTQEDLISLKTPAHEDWTEAKMKKMLAYLLPKCLSCRSPSFTKQDRRVLFDEQFLLSWS